MRVLVIAAAAALAAFGSSAAAPMPDFPTVDDTSYVEPSGDRAIQLTVRVPAPQEEVWRILTTAEGWKRFASAAAWVDLRVGGMIETSYLPEAARGARENIRNQILALVPQRLLVIRNVQAPPSFQHAEEFGRTATVIELRPAGPGATDVTLSGVGFRPGLAYDSLYASFRKGDAWTLEQLRKSVTDGPVNWGGVTAKGSETKGEK